MRMKYLNLGCGERYHPEWTNVDITSSSPYVQAHDLTKGIPFPDGSFDVVYHSHLLEHFQKDAALCFVKECHRVLRGGGIIRVAVPDLESVVRMYLEALDKALQGDPEWQRNYEWMMLELYDQAVRTYSGGAMIEFLKQNTIFSNEFLRKRLGGEAKYILQEIRGRFAEKQQFLMGETLRRFRYIPNFLREKVLKILMSKEEYRAFQIGHLRIRREIHQWMYDRYSLARMLKEAGFQRPQCFEATESQIPGWAEFHLDTEPEGAVYKPTSLYMEAVKG